MGYYVTMTHDNVEEVVGVYATNDLEKVKSGVVNEYGEMEFSLIDGGSIKAIPLHTNESYFTIIKEDK